jgi:hypothetical protein
VTRTRRTLPQRALSMGELAALRPELVLVIGLTGLIAITR